MVIPFERSFRGTDAEIPGNVLDAQLQAPGELSGLLNKALDALAQIDGRCGFTMPASVQAAWPRVSGHYRPTRGLAGSPHR